VSCPFFPLYFFLPFDCDMIVFHADTFLLIWVSKLRIYHVLSVCTVLLLNLLGAGSVFLLCNPWVHEILCLLPAL
jgi:hypothetical protein